MKMINMKISNVFLVATICSTALYGSEITKGNPLLQSCNQLLDEASDFTKGMTGRLRNQLAEVVKKLEAPIESVEVRESEEVIAAKDMMTMVCCKLLGEETTGEETTTEQRKRATEKLEKIFDALTSARVELTADCCATSITSLISQEGSKTADSSNEESDNAEIVQLKEEHQKYKDTLLAINNYLGNSDRVNKQVSTIALGIDDALLTEYSNLSLFATFVPGSSGTQNDDKNENDECSISEKSVLSSGTDSSSEEYDHEIATHKEFSNETIYEFDGSVVNLTDGAYAYDEASNSEEAMTSSQEFQIETT